MTCARWKHSISAAAGDAPVAVDEARVAELVDILMPRGATAPVLDETTPGKLLAVLWPHGTPTIGDLARFAANVQSTLEDWHLLH